MNISKNFEETRIILNNFYDGSNRHQHTTAIPISIFFPVPYPPSPIPSPIPHPPSPIPIPIPAPSPDDVEKCKEECDDAYNYYIENCNSHFPDDPVKRKLCYEAAMRKYSRCLRNCEKN
ncbi:MAG: hypothetical protein K6357_00225 [Elusimicrobiota bacterium]